MTTKRPSAETPVPIADRIFEGGTILTMNDAQPTAEAVALRGDTILAVGTRDAVLRHRGPNTEVVSLRGRTMLPGFVDGHSHLGAMVDTWGWPDLSPPPAGEVASLEDILDRLRLHLEAHAPPPGSTLVAVGYDDSRLKERRHPLADELDRVSTTHALVLIHVSAHLATANHLALTQAGYVKGAEDPPGGSIWRDERGEPTGVVTEQAVFGLLAHLPAKTPEEQLTTLEDVQWHYASRGITTAQEGQTSPDSLALLEEAARQHRLLIDIVAYPKWTTVGETISPHPVRTTARVPHRHDCDREPRGAASSSPGLLADFKARKHVGTYVGRLKVGGVKITADGSPQGKTAYLTQPYLKPPEGKPESYRGESVVSQEELDGWFDRAYAEGLQLLVHCNGDAAADMMISAVRKARTLQGPKALRPVMIHAQTVREDQLDAMRDLGILPSYFNVHTYYWGDWHMQETLGPARALRISPLASTLRRGMPLSIHSDAPVIPLEPMLLVDAAVNRTSLSGAVVGEEQRIPVMEALKALTVGNAILYSEEGTKGTIEPGKRADLVVLSSNPLTVSQHTLKDIRVLLTVKDGRDLFTGYAWRAGRDASSLREEAG
ncbi:amidohydrolase [Corallococcus sp. H22C18031201]|nr:amidohydrolase [Corallococcus sp. H22C18031201]